MDRQNTFLALVGAAIVTTVMMFLTALIVGKLGNAAFLFIVLLCIPIDLFFLVVSLVFTYVCLSYTLRSYRQMRAEEEHIYKTRYERREIELERRRWELIEYRHRVRRSIVAARRYDWKRERVNVPRQQSGEVGKRVEVQTGQIRDRHFT